MTVILACWVESLHEGVLDLFRSGDCWLCTPWSVCIAVLASGRRCEITERYAVSTFSVYPGHRHVDIIHGVASLISLGTAPLSGYQGQHPSPLVQSRRTLMDQHWVGGATESTRWPWLGWRWWMTDKEACVCRGFRGASKRVS